MKNKNFFKFDVNLVGKADIQKNKWHPVHECDDDEGNPSVWAKEVNHPLYNKYIWITKVAENEFLIEYDADPNSASSIKPLKTCRSLSAAKRWVSIHIG